MRVFGIFCAIINFVLVARAAEDCKRGGPKLVCYYGDVDDAKSCRCSHVVVPQGTGVEQLDAARGRLPGTRVLMTVREFNEDLVNALKTAKLDGLEINLKKHDSKNDINDFISTIKTKLGSDLYLALSVPPKAETLAKYYDFKALSKTVDLFILQTAFLGASKNVSFHPSRLSGLWDMQNTDSVVDLVNGLGAPLSKVVVTSPVQAFHFTLQNEKHTAPGSPALELKTLTRKELCETMNNGKNWTLERDQDQAGPYIFRKQHWIAFDDPMSIDIKAKYARVRGLAGLALKDLSQDGGDKCGGTLLEAAHSGLSRQSRAPRGAVLHSLEREILETPRPLDTIQVSPYRITRVIDVEGKVNVIRQDTRTEFECSRQGYFVHPRSCGRFYRCVKFDQLSDEFNVFEFDCPAGLAFDERVEVCVWPGSLKHGSPCAGSSEIAPVPRERFICPGEAGYYADPENCRWFFACLDHGKSPLSAYEFRCPFGLVFDQDRLVCEWPWLVPKCAAGAAVFGQTQEFVYGNLENYDGLGALGPVKLGGLSGPYVQPIAKVYTSIGVAVGYPDGDIVNTGGYKSNAQFVNEGLLSKNRQSGIAGNINIIGGGYSAVGVAADSLGTDIQITHDGSGSNLIDSVTPIPISPAATVASVPVVSSVPLPAVAASRFESFKGGVIANIPELQYKFKSPSGVFFQSNGGSSFSNDTLFVNYVSSTPTPFVGISEQEAPKITIVSTSPSPAVKPIIVQPAYQSGVSYSGYNFDSQKEEKNFNKVSGYSYSEFSAPVQKVQTVPLAQRPIYVTGYNQGEFENSGYAKYSSGDSGAVFLDQAKLFQPVGIKAQQPAYYVNYSYPATYSTPKTAIFFGSKQPAYFTPANVKGLAVTGYEYRNEHTAQKAVQSGGYVYEKPLQQTIVGYDYPKPSVAFVEKPVVSTYAPPTEVKQVVTGYEYNRPVGYDYSKPSINFEEKPVVVSTYAPPVVENKVVTYDYPKPPVIVEQKPVQPVVVSTYAPPVVKTKVEIPKIEFNYEQPSVEFKGYQYEKPSVVFEEKPITVSTIAPPKVEPAVVTTYHYQKPSVVESKVELPKVEVQPIVVSTPAPPVQVQPVQPAVVTTYQYQQPQVQFTGYKYEKPSIKFEERPVVVSTVAPPVVKTKIDVPTVQLQPVQPATITTYHYQKPQVEFTGYEYEKPSIKFEERPPVIKQNVEVPTVQLRPVQQAVITTYHYQRPQVEFTGYQYEKPSIKFEEQPVVVSTVATPVVKQKIDVPIVQVRPVQPATITTYHYQKPQVEFTGYQYEKPSIKFEEQPVVVSTVSPPVIKQKIEVPTVQVRPVQPATITTYHYQKPQVEFTGYQHEKPSIKFEEQPVVISTVAPAVVKTKIEAPAVTYHYQKSEFTGYQYEKPVVQQKPVVVSTYAPPVVQTKVEVPKPVVTTYHYQKPVVEYQKPAVVYQSTYAPPVELPKVQPAIIYEQKPVQPVVYSTPAPPVQPAIIETHHYQQPAPAVVISPKIELSQPTIVKGYDYPKPEVVFEERPVPRVKVEVQKPVTYEYRKPTVVFEEKPVVVSTPPPLKGYDYPKPAVAFEEGYREPVYEEPFVKKTAYVTGSNFKQQGASYEYISPLVEKKPIVVSTTPAYEQVSVAVNPFKQYSQSVDVSKSYYGDRKVVTSTPAYYASQKPVVYYSTPPAVYYSTPKPTFESAVLGKEVKQSRPIVRYEFSSLGDQYLYTSTPKTVVSTTYQPVEQRTYPAPKTTYLPVTTTTYSPPSTTKLKYVEAYVAPEVEVSTPSNAYLPAEDATRRPVKVIKVVRPKVTKIVKENDFHPLLSAKLGAQCTCVSNTVKLKRPIPPPPVDLEEDDEYYVKSSGSSDETGGVAVESYQYEPQRIVEVTQVPVVKKVRPVTEVTIRKSDTKSVDEYSDKEIADTVRKGLNLIKSAAKEGAKEGTKEALNSPAFDRYGPGGWRSRDETLQGTIDCQRAGLFRHPTQCNKFYACRWDCTKNRYTLHVFNCPVHLTFDNTLGACNWPSQGPACLENTLLPSD